MISRYRLLFRVSLRHDYFRDGRPSGFAITPSSATSALLASSGLLLKAGGDNLLVLARVDTEGRPVAPVPADARFSFYLEPVGSELLAVTNVDPDGLRTRRFYFSNLSGNAAGSGPAALNLSGRIAGYLETETYLPGDLAASGSAVFECLRMTRGQAPAPDSDFWVSRNGVQYVSKGDLLPMLPQTTVLRLRAGADAFRIHVFGLDPALNRLTRPVREELVTATPGDGTGEVAVNLAGLPPGRYRVNVNGEEFEAYFDDEAKARGAFGVIEIFNHLPGGDAFSLIGLDGAVKGTAYVIRFANRMAYWKYLNPGQQVESILFNSDPALPSPFVPGSDAEAEPARRHYFLSRRPLPLSDAPAENRFDLMVAGAPFTAPKPDPGIPGMITRSFDSATRTYRDFVCNIHLKLFTVNQGR